MIKAKDLLRRKYDGKDCVGFDCEVDTERMGEIDIRFRKLKRIEFPGYYEAWRVETSMSTDKVLPHVYTISYTLPKSGLPLELIAATGINYIMDVIREDMRAKEELMFSLNEMVKGM